MSRTRALMCTVLALLVPLLISAEPASARPLERGEVRDVRTDTFTDFCGVEGFTVARVMVTDFTYSINSHGADGLIYVSQHASSTETLTNVANGRSVVDKTHVVSKDLHVTDNGEGILTIEILVTGTSNLYGPDGKVIARNPGQVRYELVVDDNGTPTDPSDDTELGFTQTKGSTGRSDDYCEAITEAIL